MQILSLRLIASAAAVIAIFIGVSLAQEMSRRLAIQREVAQLEADAAQLERSLLEMESLNQYFRTSAFQELMAREKLNYSRPGETVVLLPETAMREETVVSKEAAEASPPIPRRWWNVFFATE